MTTTATAPHPSETRHPFDDAPIVHRYTRADAIRDGVLADVTETAREAGFSIPVAITAAVQDQCVRWTEDDARRKPRVHQDEAGPSGTYSGWQPAEAARSPAAAATPRPPCSRSSSSRGPDTGACACARSSSSSAPATRGSLWQPSCCPTRTEPEEPTPASRGKRPADLPDAGRP